MGTFYLKTRMVSHPVYAVEARSEKEARRLFDDGELLEDPISEDVVEEYIIEAWKED